MFSTALQLAAVATTAVAWVPQALSASRSRSVAGVSTAAWTAAAALGAVWAFYGAAHGLWLLAASEALFALGSMLVVASLTSPARAATTTLLGATAGLCALVALPALVFSAAGVVASFSVRAAQLARMVRLRDASGVADASWWLLSVALGCWGAVGLLDGRPALVAGSASGLVASVAVVVVGRHLRRTAPPR